jgi:hypothetical protein
LIETASETDVELFIHWLYELKGNIFETGSFYHLGRVWSLALKWRDERYQNFIVDAVQDAQRDGGWHVEADWHLKVCVEANWTGTESLLKDYLLEFLAFQVSAGGWSCLRTANEGWGAFIANDNGRLIDALVAKVDALNSGDGKDLKARKDCTWHSHGTELAAKGCARLKGKVLKRKRVVPEGRRSKPTLRARKRVVDYANTGPGLPATEDEDDSEDDDEDDDDEEMSE